MLRILKTTKSLTGLTAVISAAQPQILRCEPQNAELRYTFGGAVPVRSIESGTRMVSRTECGFDGDLRQPGMLPSESKPRDA